MGGAAGPQGAELRKEGTHDQKIAIGQEYLPISSKEPCDRRRGFLPEGNGVNEGTEVWVCVMGAGSHKTLGGGGINGRDWQERLGVGRVLAAEGLGTWAWSCG